MSNVDDRDLQSNPYVGLRPFFTEDSLYFFGRSQQTAELLEILHQHRFLGVVGSSGSGKSSLVLAGLLPGLLGGFLTNDRDQWHIIVIKPGDAPIGNLARALLKEKETGRTPVPASVAELEQNIRDDHTDAVVQFLTPHLESSANVFILVDQFEEIFAFRGTSQEDGGEITDLARRKERARRKVEAADFVDLLLSLAEQQALPIYVALTMRTDFLGDCDLFYGLPEALNRGRYLVPRLTRQQLREAIEGPARLMRQHIAPRLLDHLLNALGDRFDRLPVLQHALLRTWDEWQHAGGVGPIDLQHFAAAGELEGALDQDAEGAMKGLDERVTERVFRRLTDTDLSQRRVRSPARISQLRVVARADRSTVEGIVQRFQEDGRSFVYASADGKPDDPRVDISHESLIRQWNRLRKWVDEEREARDQYLELVSRARKRDRALLRDSDLQSVIAWKDDVLPTPEWAERYSRAGDDFYLAMRYVDESLESQCRNLAEVELERRWNKIWNPIIILTLLLAVGFTVKWKEEIRRKVETTAKEHGAARVEEKVESLAADSAHREAEALARNVEVLAPPQGRSVDSKKISASGLAWLSTFQHRIGYFFKALLRLWYLASFLLVYLGLQWAGKKIHRRYAFRAILDGFRASGGRVAIEARASPEELPDAAATRATAYASTVRRVVGGLIDLELNLFLAFLAVLPILLLPDDIEIYAWYAACLVINWSYSTLQIASSWQATLGMRAIGVFRTDLLGERLSFARASKWYVYRLLSILCCGLGYLLQPFTKKKQTFHDWMAGTVVLLRPPDLVVVDPTNYASALRRIGGFLIDLETKLILAFVVLLLFSISGTNNGYLWVGTYLVIDWLYSTLQIASSWQATLGMRAVGVVRTDLLGERLSFARASKWYVYRLLSILCCGLGFLPQPFTKKKQTFHDWMAGTVVLLRPPIAAAPSNENVGADLPRNVGVPSSAALAHRA